MYLVNSEKADAEGCGGRFCSCCGSSGGGGVWATSYVIIGDAGDIGGAAVVKMVMVAV